MASNILTNVVSYRGVLTLPTVPFQPQTGGLILAHPLNSLNPKTLPTKGYLTNLTINQFGIGDVTDPMVQPTTKLIFSIDNSPLLQFNSVSQAIFVINPINNFIDISSAPTFVDADNLIVNNLTFDKNIIITPTSTINVWFFNDESLTVVDLLKGYTVDYRFTYVPIN